MLDYVKLRVEDAGVDHLFNHPQLDFKVEASRSTGEIGRWYVAEHHYCKISIYEYADEKRKKSRVIFAGSIHKMWNSLIEVVAPNYDERQKYTGFNGNDFSLSELVAMLRYIADILDCELSDLIFENVEFGLNLCVQFNLVLFLKGLLYHRNCIFEFQYDRNSAQAKHQRYIFKVYNKSYQYGMKHDVLRVELKYMKMLEINALGIHSAADINTASLSKLFDLLISKVDEIVYYDYTIRKRELKRIDKNALLRFSNIHYWMDMASSQRDRPKKKLAHYIENHSDNARQKLVQNMNEKIVIINRSCNDENNVLINHVGISIITTNNYNAFCLVTGLNISMQRKGSLLLSHTGLKFYQQHFPGTFSTIKKKYLTSTWVNYDNQKQIEEMAHNIRTFRKNRKRQQKRLYNESQIKLFDLSPISNVAD